MPRLMSIVTSLALIANVHAFSLSDLSDRDAGSGLSEALHRSSEAAVGMLGQPDGFLGNPAVKIPLPEPLQKAEHVLKMMGMSAKADELVTTMNRAAESAVVEAKPILWASIKKMSWQDAKGILTGGDTAATDYFRRTTHDDIGRRFLPIVQKATSRLKLAEQYNELAGKAAGMGLLKKEDANIDQYVTEKTLDGLYHMIGEQEKAIRQDPMGQASKLLQRVFSAH